MSRAGWAMRFDARMAARTREHEAEVDAHRAREIRAQERARDDVRALYAQRANLADPAVFGQAMEYLEERRAYHRAQLAAEAEGGRR